MKLIIFGATGETGIALCEQAVRAGHETTAFCRPTSSRQRLEAIAGLQVVLGDVVNDVAAVTSALRGKDVILSALGPRGIWSPDTSSTRAMHVIREAVAAAEGGPRRVVVCSSLGAGDSAPHIAWFAAWLLKHALADKTTFEAALVADAASAGLSYLIVRPPRLLNVPARGLAAVTEAPSNGDLPTKAISRADVAAYMLAHLEGKEGTVNISWTSK